MQTAQLRSLEVRFLRVRIPPGAPKLIKGDNYAILDNLKEQ